MGGVRCLNMLRVALVLTFCAVTTLSEHDSHKHELSNVRLETQPRCALQLCSLSWLVQIERTETNLVLRHRFGHTNHAHWDLDLAHDLCLDTLGGMNATQDRQTRVAQPKSCTSEGVHAVRTTHMAARPLASQEPQTSHSQMN